MRVSNILIVGVGGQGTLLASKVLGALALETGNDVKVSELHGMAQRGGSVVTHVRFGSEVHAPLIDEGGADVILAFEKLEAARYLNYLKLNGSIIYNEQEILPMPVIMGATTYPEVSGLLQASASKIYAVDARGMACACGNERALNVVLLGVLAQCMDFEKESWLTALRAVISPKFLELNLAAFEQGYAFDLN